MSDHLSRRRVAELPRIPLKGSLDLTYRCNNDCRHCWLRLPPDSKAADEEMSLSEVVDLVDAAREMGCGHWSISGGEPMLRPDFEEIFSHITEKGATYTLNTNGTLITPAIARLMKRKGSKLVALYGATAEVHDRITRNPGSFDATMEGIAHLREAGAGFTMQVIPMRDNYHQHDEMVRLAGSLSRSWRIGAPWLWLSAGGDPGKNREIAAQRLEPCEVVRLDEPDLGFEEWVDANMIETCRREPGDDRLYAACIRSRRDFHVDAAGRMSFCVFVKDPTLRYDLRKGSFREAWEDFIPSLSDKVRGSREYLENCGACEARRDCRWCAVYGYLEHRDHSRRVDYLCRAARTNRVFKEEWARTHRRFFDIAGITVRVESDLAFREDSFAPKFKLFEVPGPGDDVVSLRHHFSLPDLDVRDLGRQVYRRTPWAIYQKGDAWIYLGIVPSPGDPRLQRVVVFNRDHTRAHIHNPDDGIFKGGRLDSLTMFASDQILIARVLAERKGCILHSAGIILNGKGLVFAGHSEAGKSTMIKLMRDRAEVLCDDRNIVRRGPDGFRVHGTWNHGEIPEVSHSSAPLRAILFIEKAPDNKLIPIEGKVMKVAKFLEFVVKPLVTADWWERVISLAEDVAAEIPFYVLHCDRSGRVADLLEEL